MICISTENYFIDREFSGRMMALSLPNIDQEGIDGGRLVLRT
jgi:hypothetical protein